MKIDIFEFPENLHYVDGHSWAKAEDGLVRVGLDDFFQKIAGAVVYVELPAVGTTIQQMKPFGVISSTNQKANRAFIGPPKDFKFDMKTLELLAIRGGFCHCRLGERCPCARADVCPCQAYVPVNYMIAPVSGNVVEVNKELEDSPWNINMDPYGVGWVITVKPTNLKEELKNLVTDNAVKGWLNKDMDAKSELVKTFKELWEGRFKEYTADK
jgi:glycine cleavage system H protein